jgi:hypothetical protein
LSELTPEDVANYLRENPIFFEDHAELLSQIRVASPHGGQAIPLADRQVQGLREKTRALEGKLTELIQFGEENDVISERVHRLGVALLASRSAATFLHELYFNLREDFAVPHAALRVWRGGGEGVEFGPVSPELKAYVAELDGPFCGPNANFEPVAWFGEASPHIRSMAFMPLRELDETFGIFVLASEDLLRFYPEMGTLYLKRLGEMVSAGLLRFV